MPRWRTRSLSLAAAIGVAAATLMAPTASSDPVADEGDEGPVYPDPGFIEQVPGEPCTPETPYEIHTYGTDARYAEACKRIRFAFGPIHVKPGQNEAVLEPVTIQKPRYDGYIVRFKPDLVRALDGGHPRTEDMHLHHATWLNLGNSYGDGPFFAAGEEKTIANFPDGYGMKVEGEDQWGLLYMVHNATTSTESVWLTYQIDYVPTAAAEELGIVPVKPLWLDVQKSRIHPDAPSTSSNPVFNVQRGFGHIDPETGRQVCSWPDENCARFDAYGNVSPQQGTPVDLAGKDYTVPSSMAGTIIGLGGHLHPGGIRLEVSQLRGEAERLIHISDALYWEYDDGTSVGAPPHSWNLSMTTTGAPLGWKVKIRQGDVIRLNAIYDSQDASWYENMGIVVAYVAPDDPHGDPGVDVFEDDVVIERGVPTTALTPPGPWVGSWTPPDCTPDLTGVSGQKRLCVRGQVTHGPIEESSNGGDACGPDGCPPLPDKEGPELQEIHTAGFTYGPADLGVIGTTGVPRIKLGVPVRLWSWDSVARIWHTFTRCAEPCTGPTLINYPIANGGTGDPTDEMDFDSSEIGFGLFWEPAKSQIGGSEPYNRKWVEDALFWDFTPTRTGTYSFYCRIHPGMRGAFEVVE